MTVAAFHQLTLQGVDYDVQVETVAIHARLHGGEEIVVSGRAARGHVPAEIDADALLGRRAELHFGADEYSPLGGIVSAVEIHDLGGATFTLTPSITALSHTLDHRVFLDQDAVSIAREVLSDHVQRLEQRLDKPPPPRAQRVQAFESDLAFVSRILADEGITWFIERNDGAAQLVVVDHPGAFRPIEGDARLPYGGGDGLRTSEAVLSAQLHYRLRHDRVTLRDYSFEKPALDLTAEAKIGDAILESYAFPGPRRYDDPEGGRQLGQRRLEAVRHDAVVLRGMANTPRLAVGRTFELYGAPRDDMNGHWLIVSLDCEGHERFGETERRQRFEARFTAVPAQDGWRPSRVERPSLGGIQTATITGSAGDEIHTEEYGRVTARLRHDRRRPLDATSSAWMRVLHPATSGGFMLPRVGWEALLAFAGPSADVPFVLGRLDNGAAPTAEELPGELRRSSFGTPTTPGGASANLLRMDDSAGSEQILLNASRDYNEQTKNNKATSIVGNDERKVGTDQTLTYEGSHGVKVSSPQFVKVSGNRTVTGNGGMVIEAGSETVVVGGMREFTVGGHYSSKIGGVLLRAVGGAKIVIPIAGDNRHVDSASLVVVGGAWITHGSSSSISVAGASVLNCASTLFNAGKSFTLDCNGLSEVGGARIESAPTIALNASVISLSFGATTLTAPVVTICASGSVTINAGGGSIEVSPGSVKFSGAFNASGKIRSEGTASVE